MVRLVEHSCFYLRSCRLCVILNQPYTLRHIIIHKQVLSVYYSTVLTWSIVNWYKARQEYVPTKQK